MEIVDVRSGEKTPSVRTPFSVAEVQNWAETKR